MHGTSEDTARPATDKAEQAQSPTAAFGAECRAGLEQARKSLVTVLAVSGERTIENTLEPYNDLVTGLVNSLDLASLMREVHPDAAIRDEARACERDAQAFASELRLNPELYQAFAGLKTDSYDPEARRLVELTLRDFRRAGVDRDEATRQRIKEIDDKLTEQSQAFQKNISEDVRQIALDSEDELAGMPEDYKAAHRPGADGKIAITTNYPDYVPFLTYADSDQRRKEIYILFKSRGGQDNERILGEIFALRAEKAKLLGYKNWADYITEDKMMKSAKNAADFIERVAKVARKRSQRDYNELLARKRKDQRGAKLVEDWEKTYYENKVKAEKYAFDSQSVRPYLPFEQVQDGLLAITSKTYDIEYKKAPDARIWHEDVQVYDVMQKGKKIGRIYLDMHPRDGKYKHAAQFSLHTGVEGKQLPEGVLVCNFPNPRTTSGPALMEHDDVVTMFHEFGHLMHHIFGGHKRWVTQSGTATEWDFVEAPSQMFEEWAWSHETLATFARRPDTGEVIPAEMVERMRRADKFGLGAYAMQQLFYASISLGFHTADPKTLDMTRMVKTLQAKYTPFRFVDGTSFHTSFGHLDGYSAIYYTYMWSLVIAKDLLTPFKKNGLMNTEWTYRYRDRILAPGGSKDAAVLVRDFLGRDFSFDAFKDYLGS